MRKLLIAHALTALLLAPLATTIAHAEPAEFFQVKTSRQPESGPLWRNLWRALSGEKNLETADLTVKVTDAAGNPLAGAAVLVGPKKGSPFAANFALTGADGTALFHDEALRDRTPLTVTASLAGHSTLSLVGNTDNQVELSLAKIPGERDYSFLKGKVTGFPPGYGGGTLELGLFLPAFRPESLLNFDPQQFISSYEVKINVFGERDVPGNVVFPPQRKRYGLIPISLSKPEYIMPLPRGLDAHMGALAGAVDISDAVKLIKNKDFLGTLNIARFTHLGFTNNKVEVRGDETFNLNVSNEIAAGAAKAEMSGIPSGLDAVSVAFFDKEGDRGDFLPMDIKAVKSESIKNGSASLALGLLKQRRPQDKFYVFTGLFDRAALDDKNSTSHSIVGSLQPVASQGGSRFKGFLKPIRPGEVSGGNRDYRFNSPANGAIVPDFVLLNIVSEKKNELTQGKTRSLLWSAVLPGTADGVSLPDLGRPVLPAPDSAKGEKFYWEVIAVKAGANKAAPKADLDIQSAIRNLSHVSSLSQKF
jgi:hypothetical protein